MKNTSLIQKCDLCQREMGFNDPTIRHEKKWYHAECYESTVQEQVLEKEQVVKDTIVKQTPIEKLEVTKEKTRD